MIAHFFSRDNEIEAGIAFFRSLIPFHFSPSICATTMAAKTSGRRVVNSSWSTAKGRSAEGPRWWFSWDWGTFPSCPPHWAECLHLHLTLCGPAWDPRETESAEEDSHETFWMLGCVRWSTSAPPISIAVRKALLVITPPKSLCDYFCDEVLGLIQVLTLSTKNGGAAPLLFHRYHLQSTEQEEMVRKVCALQCTCATRSQN